MQRLYWQIDLVEIAVDRQKRIDRCILSEADASLFSHLIISVILFLSWLCLLFWLMDRSSGNFDDLLNLFILVATSCLVTRVVILQLLDLVHDEGVGLQQPLVLRVELVEVEHALCDYHLSLTQVLYLNFRFLNCDLPIHGVWLVLGHLPIVWEASVQIYGVKIALGIPERRQAIVPRGLIGHVDWLEVVLEASQQRFV